MELDLELVFTFQSQNYTDINMFPVASHAKNALPVSFPTAALQHRYTVLICFMVRSPPRDCLNYGQKIYLRHIFVVLSPYLSFSLVNAFT